MKKIIILLLLASQLTACNAFTKTENIQNSNNKPIEKIEGEGINIGYPIGISFDYYRKCKEEYDYEVDDGRLLANNNGLDIVVGKGKNEDEIYWLEISTNKENKDNLLNEINTALKLSNIREITMKEFDEMSNSAYTKEESKALDKGEDIEPKDTFIIDDIIIAKFASDGFKDGTFWTIQFHREKNDYNK